jgi:hypothetical protein
MAALARVTAGAMKRSRYQLIDASVGESFQPPSARLIDLAFVLLYEIADAVEARLFFSREDENQSPFV